MTKAIPLFHCGAMLPRERLFSYKPEERSFKTLFDITNTYTLLLLFNMM